MIEPQIAYANLMVPGQELAVHTDVPEFRGVSRKTVPQWLLVVMHHSGLFDAWRLHIATGVAWFSDLCGGALAYWPDGPEGPQVRHPIRANTALVLDTDSVFHGVARVAPVAADAMPPIRPGCGLAAEGDRWVLRGADDAVLADYDWSELRLSVSWKAYCFAGEAERDTWHTHADDLTLDVILETLPRRPRVPAGRRRATRRAARARPHRRIRAVPRRVLTSGRRRTARTDAALGGCG